MPLEHDPSFSSIVIYSPEHHLHNFLDLLCCAGLPRVSTGGLPPAPENDREVMRRALVYFYPAFANIQTTVYLWDMIQCSLEA